VPVESDRFRRVLGSWATGVTIVTSRHGEDVHGMTVSAFTSVSLDPPLVLVCADKSSNTHEFIQRSGVFSVNILREEQEELSNRFASTKHEDVRFEGMECVDGATGCPHIPGAFATLDCRVTEAVEAGDHRVYVASVEAAEASDADPLLYYRGAYRKLARA
jgi:flavin reductase (DIM6/NTAB) family NADH-FMN oxidoreductase RutF